MGATPAPLGDPEAFFCRSDTLALVPWLELGTWLLAAHILGNVVWIGSLLAVSLLVAVAPRTADAAGVGALARQVHLRLAVPGFLLSLVAGVARILRTPAIYAHMPWFHAKLTFALVVIVLHHVIGARAKRVARGRVPAAGTVDLQAIGVLLCAAGAVLLGVAKSLP
jgi:putative membrane protein